MVAAAVAIVALAQATRAQSAPPRPNLSILLEPSLLYTPLAADFDRDGRVDLVAGKATDSGTNLVIRRGTGGGSFATEQVIAAGFAPLAAAGRRRWRSASP